MTTLMLPKIICHGTAIKVLLMERIKIENYHSWLKRFIKVKSLYEHNITLLLIIISRRLT